MNNYEEFLQNLNREAYHEGEIQWEEGEFTVCRTHPWSPPGCHNSCGCLMYLKDGKLDHVEGDPLSPYNNGKLCMRCLDMDEATNHVDRLKYPMKRAREHRGDNSKWERISWDEAFDIFEENVRRIKTEYGVQAFNVVRGTGRDIDFGSGILAALGIQTWCYDMQFMTGFACYSPRLIPSNSCVGNYWIADASQGHPLRYANPEWRAPGVLIVWGVEPLKSNADGYLGHWLVECVQLGTKIITIDPRLTWWAARSEYFLQLRSGTDTPLIMSMMDTIIKEELYDKDFVERWCYGFDELAQVCAQFPAEKAAEICDVDAEDIKGAARLFATEGPGCIQWGLALCQQESCLSNTLCGIDLEAICGYMDVPGGSLLVNDAFGFAHHVGEGYLPDWAQATNRHFVSEDAKWGETRQAMIDWENRDENRIRCVIYASCNPLANACQEPGRLYEHMKDMDFVVGMDPFMTPTLSAFADLVLPVAMSIEKNSIRSWWTPLRCTWKISQFYEARSDEYIGIQMTKRLNPGVMDDWVESSYDMCNWRLKGVDTFAENSVMNVEKDLGLVAGQDKAPTEKPKLFKRFNNYAVKARDVWNPEDDFEALKRMSPVFDSFCSVYYKYEKGMLRPNDEPGFKTTTGRIELYSLACQAWGIFPMPEYTEPIQSPVNTPELFEKYPLILNSGVRSYEFFHSEHRQLETMREFHPWPQVCMNQNVAERFGIQEGQWTWVENDCGRFMQMAHIVPTMKDYCISAEAGWWYPEDQGDYPVYNRCFDSNPNNCIPFDNLGKDGIGASVKTTLVTVSPVKPGDITPTQQIVEMGGFPMQRERREAYEAMWKEKGLV